MSNPIVEPSVEPDLPILDPHVHLFESSYRAEDFVADATSGHNIVGSVFMSSSNAYWNDLTPDLRPLGEVAFANFIGSQGASGAYGKVRINAGIVGFAELTLGDAIAPMLDHGLEIAPDRLRGVRQVLLDHPSESPYQHMIGRPDKGVLQHPKFRDGFRHLAPRGLSFDACLFHTQLPDLVELIDEFPDTLVVLDHLGMPMGLDASHDQARAEVFAAWRTSLGAVAERPNVVCKVGGLGMPFAGFGFEKRAGNVHSSELAAAWRPYVETTIDIFGVSRCMMESNFPPDGLSSSYAVLWNALKTITAPFSDEEKSLLYLKTAATAYRIDQLT